jgi:two-component system, chemotaxis family, chemotaxis protein CheY
LVRDNYGETLRNTIVVVDDDASLREAVAELLRTAGYRVFAAEHGREALLLLRIVEPVDLLITDIRMPVLDGLQLIDVLKRHAITVPVLVLSAEAERQSTPSEVVAWARKPVPPEQLLSLVREIVASYAEDSSHREREVRRMRTFFGVALPSARIIRGFSVSGRQAGRYGDCLIAGVGGSHVDPRVGVAGRYVFSSRSKPR